MAKCNLAILFEKPDRTFRVGDIVRGNVNVTVNKDVTCNGLLLNGFYKTHGKGNREQRDYATIILGSGKWNAGEQYRFPFQFEIPQSPPTYHGNVLNIDHCVRARADIPWAIDPKCTAEVVVLEGKPPANPAPAASGDTQSKFAPVGQIVGLFFMIIGVVFALPSFGISILLFVVGGFITFMSMQKKLAERRLGKVTLSGVPLIANSGQEVPIEISFTPNRNGKLNRILVSITGCEQVVSGSGTNAKTHRHILHEKETELATNDQIRAGTQSKYSVKIQIPGTTAYTNDLNSNKIIWTTKIHIDIPKWPDWIYTQRFNLVPGDSNIPPVQLELPKDEWSASPPRDVVPPVITSAFSGTSKATTKSPSGNAYDGTGNFGNLENRYSDSDNFQDSATAMPSLRDDLVAVVQKLISVDRFSKEHESIVNDLSNEFFEVNIVVDRVSPTHGYFSDDAYRDGRTINGTVKGTSANIQLQLPNDYNSELEDVDSNDIWTGKGVIIKWDPLYERVEMLGL